MGESANCGKAHTAVQYSGKIMYLFDYYQVYDCLWHFYHIFQSEEYKQHDRICHTVTLR